MEEYYLVQIQLLKSSRLNVFCDFAPGPSLRVFREGQPTPMVLTILAALRQKKSPAILKILICSTGKLLEKHVPKNVYLSLAILKILICSTGRLLEKHVLISYTCIAKCSNLFQSSVFKWPFSSSLLLIKGT